MTSEAKLPPGLFLTGPSVVYLPIRALGGIVMDGRSQNLAHCPNSSMADFIAWSINVFNGVHSEHDHA